MDDLDAAVALVYAQPPSGFVAARGALVKELKAAGRKEDAARVAALRRPTKQAWALGEAVRRAPVAAAAFFTAIEGLARPGGDLRRRTAELREAAAGLVEAVEGQDPGAATAALLAVGADPRATAALQAGRLAEVPVAGGFGGLTPAPEAPAGAASGGPTGPDGPGAPPPGAGAGAVDGDGGRSAAATEAEAEAEGERREEEARGRAERLAVLAAEHREAAAAEAAAARSVEAARAALDGAQAELERATRSLAVARAAAAAAAERLEAAPPP